jgi:hypothetical protein
MNLTVGPLPPAVYWRRRAIVAGSLLVFVLLVAYSCGGSGGSKAASPRQTPPATSSPDPTTSLLSPIIGGPPASGSAGPGGSGAPASSAPPGDPAAGAAATGSDFCTDSEMQLTPAAQRITGGTYAYELTLTIKNISTRSCKRDVGADPQELHIVLNGQTVWSSDSCQKAQSKPPDIRTFGPNIEAKFTVGWDGTTGPNCSGGQAIAAGSYQLVAKLDTKVSSPAAFTVAGK